MADALGLAGVAVILLVNTALAAVTTRFFRVRLHTGWGSLLYVLVLGPLLLVGVLFVLSGVLGLGTDLGGQGTVLAVTVALPLALGISIDYFWMPAPESDAGPRRSR